MEASQKRLKNCQRVQVILDCDTIEAWIKNSNKEKL